MRRWLGRILVLLLILALLVGVTVQGVLWTDLPRQQVIAALESETGLSVHIDALEVGWLGDTEARGLRLALPMPGEAFVEAPHMRVRHTALPWLLLTQTVDLHAVTLERPTVHLRQDARGAWNVARVIETVQAAQPPDPAPTPGPLALPGVAVRDATLRIIPADEDPIELTGVGVRGRTGQALDYNLDLDAPTLGTVRARVARVAPHAHEVEFELAPPPALLALLGIEPPASTKSTVDADQLAAFARPLPAGVPAALAEAPTAGELFTRPVAMDPDAPPTVHAARGQWRGRFGDTGITGELSLDTLDLPGLGRVRGGLALHHHQGEDALLIRPSPGLRLEPIGEVPGPVGFVAGRLTWHAGRLLAEDVRLRGMEGEVQLTADLDPTRRLGELSADWRGVVWPAGVEHRGQLELTLRRHGAAQRRIEATVQTGIGSPLGRWRGRAELEAVGRDWDEFEATLATRDLQLTRDGESQRLPDLAAELSLAAPVVRLERLGLHAPGPEQRLRATGQYDWQAGDWSLTLDAGGVSVPGLAAATDLAELRLDASGTDRHVRLHQGRINTAGIVATATGGYEPAATEPVQLDLQVREAPIQVGDQEHLWLDADNLIGGLRVVGTLQPLALEARGELVARSLRVYNETIGDLTLAVQAEMDHHGIEGRAAAGNWLGGDWRVEASYPYDGRPRLVIDGEAIDLARVDQLLGRRLALGGEADVHLVTTPPANPQALQSMRGAFELRDVVRDPVRADRITGQLELLGSRLRVTDLEAQRGDGRVRGDLAIQLEPPMRLNLDQTLERWPLVAGLEPLELHVSGHAGGSFDLLEGEGQASSELRTTLIHDGRPLVDFDSQLQLLGSVLNLNQLEGMLLDGSITGRGRTDLTDVSRSELVIQLREIDLGQFEAIGVDDLLVSVASLFQAEPVTIDTYLAMSIAVQILEDLSEKLEGSIVLGPTDHRRAIGPIRLDVTLRETEVAYRELPIGAGALTAYFDPDRDRYVLHESSLDVAGGRLSLWGRISRHPGPPPTPRDPSDRGGTWYAFAQGGLDALDLELLTTHLLPEGPPILGRLSGSATLSTPLDDWSSAFGRGELNLRNSDIAGVPIFSMLYDLMNVRFLDPQPEGEGEARFRVDGGELVFDRFQYSNRGTHLELAGRVTDIWAGDESPIEGLAVASLSPLPDILMLDVVNRALALLQTDVTTVQLDGTVREPRARPVPFRGVQQTLGRILGGAEYEPPDTEYEADEEIEFRLEIERERERERAQQEAAEDEAEQEQADAEDAAMDEDADTDEDEDEDVDADEGADEDDAGADPAS